MEIQITYTAIAVIIGALLLAGLVIVVLARMVLKELRGKGDDLLGMSRQDILKRWQQIEELVARRDELSGKLAIMEADKLLDHALKARHFGGNTLGERLKLACYSNQKLKNVWPAHLVRNRLVHEANYHLPSGAVGHNIRLFRDALKELNVL